MTVPHDWTVRKMLSWMSDDFAKRGIESAKLDAELLLAHATGRKRLDLYLDLDRPLLDPELAAIRQWVERRRRGEPMAYLLGYRDFWKHRFTVSPAVLIPRADTELLVEVANALSTGLPDGAWVDLCTGSGCVAISLALDHSERQVFATDLSSDALAVALQNNETLRSNVHFELGDLFGEMTGPFSLVVANPPYIPTAELASLMRDVRDFEPRLALDGEADGLHFYRRIVTEAKERLVVGAAVAVEVGHDQAESVAELFRAASYTQVRTRRDLAGILRVVSARWGVADDGPEPADTWVESIEDPEEDAEVPADED